MTLEEVSSQLKQVIGRFFWNVVDYLRVSPKSREAKQDVVILVLEKEPEDRQNIWG